MLPSAIQIILLKLFQMILIILAVASVIHLHGRCWVRILFCLYSCPQVFFLTELMSWPK